MKAAGAARGGPGWADGGSRRLLFYREMTLGLQIQESSHRIRCRCSEAVDVIAGVHQGKLQTGIVHGVGVDGDGCRLVVLWLGGHDIGHEGLRVAVIERKPGALDFDHYGMAGFENMIHIVKAELVFAH